MKIKELEKKFGAFKFTEIAGGAVKIDQSWSNQNIIFLRLPIIKPKVGINRLIVPQFAAAIYETYVKGIGYMIETFDGCWVARHRCWDPSRALSTHSWGVAFDINAKTNGYGLAGNMPLALVEIFEKWGFEWGGRWKTKDPMHFQLRSLLP